MPELQGFNYPDLGGGANIGADASDISSREMAGLENFYPYEGRLRRRGGTKRIDTGGLTGNPYTGQITGMLPFKRSSTGAFMLLVGGTTGFGKLAGTALEAITPAGGYGARENALPWCMFQYKDYAYAMRAAGGGMVRINETEARGAGIGAPGSAPTLTGVGAGTLPIGTYEGVVTFVNLETNYESNPSAVGTVNIVSPDAITWSNIPVSTDPFVNARRLYRSLENQTGAYYLVTTITNNTTTTFTPDNVLVNDLGRAVSFRNGVPPSNVIAGCVGDERIWVTDGKDLYYSELLLGEMFSGNFLPVHPDDGHPVRAVHFHNKRVIVGKTNKVYYVLGNIASQFSMHTLSDEFGCMSHQSMHDIEGDLIWYGSGKTVVRAAGGVNARDISTPRIKPILEDIPDEMEEFVVGAVFPERHWYVLSVPQKRPTTTSILAATNNSRLLVYNYRENTWTVFSHYSEAPQFLVRYFNADYGAVLYSTHYDGKLYEWNKDGYGYDDIDGVMSRRIAAYLLTKADDFGYPGYRKALDQVWLLTGQRALGAQDLQISVFGDGGIPVGVGVNDPTMGVQQLSRYVDLSADSDWQAFKMPTWRNPQTRFQTRLTYTGIPQISIDGLHFEVGTLRRGPQQPR